MRRQRRTGQKRTMRIWPEALAALRAMKCHFPERDHYGVEQRIVSSALLFLAAESAYGLKYRSNGPGLIPIPASEVREFDRHQALYDSKPQPSRTGSRPALRLV